MDVYILRHGEAEEPEEGVADRDRKLTAKGKRDLAAVLEAGRNASAAPDLILASPLRRARDTAAMAAEILGCKRVVQTRSLAPGASPELVWKEIGAERDVREILLAGHEPHLGKLVQFLLEAAVVVDLKKGALVRVTTQGRLGPPRGVLKWMITPRVARRK